MTAFPNKGPPAWGRPFMLGRIWVGVLLVTLTGCAARFRPKAFLLNMNIPVEFRTSSRLVQGGLSFNPPHCRNAALPYRKGCEQMVVGK